MKRTLFFSYLLWTTPVFGLFFTEQELLQLKRCSDSLAHTIGWHWKFPTTGFLLEPPSYPYIPHFFTVQQLAPRKGAGVTLVLLDTGVSAFDCPPCMRHPDLIYRAPVSTHNCFLYGTGAFERLLAHVYKYCAPHRCVPKTVEESLIQLLIQYHTNQKWSVIRSFIQNYGNRHCVRRGKLTQYGIRCAHELENGVRTVCVDGVLLGAPYNQRVVRQLLPLPGLSNHGTHVYSLIAARCRPDIGIHGVAPSATTVMLKVFNDAGCSDKKTIIAGLEKARSLNADIVVLSLKVADALDMTEQSCHQLESLLAQFPFVVAAAGNNGESVTGVAYPARSSAGCLAVGAFGYDPVTKICTIPPFSQYEPKNGPFFVAPGVDIVGCALDYNTRTHGYVCTSGTSCAAALMSGFLALIVGEFKDDFSHEQILEVCYASTVKMHNNSEWNSKVVGGVLDVRTALFTLHVLRAVKNAIRRCSALSFSIETHFDQLVRAVRTVLLFFVEEYGTRSAITADFRLSFMDYYSAAQQSTSSAATHLLGEYGITVSSVESALLFCRNCILAALDCAPFFAKVPLQARFLIERIKTSMHSDHLIKHVRSNTNNKRERYRPIE